jgi:hypothetical protein
MVRLYVIVSVASKRGISCVKKPLKLEYWWPFALQA